MLKFDNVSFAYAGSNDNVLKNISFSIECGEFVVLCGQSGCGKSTLLKHIKKNQIPEGIGTGNMYFENIAVELMDDRKSASDIGFVGQNPDGQIVTDKVWHELAFGLENLGIGLDEMRRRVGELAEYFGISGWFEKSTDELSGGQKQILTLAAVMVMQPKLIILDEPTSQLDPIAADKFIHTVEKLNRDFGVTILMSEQRLEDIFPIADRVLIMHKGKLVGNVSAGQAGKLIKQANLPVYNALPPAQKLFMDFNGKGIVPLTIREGSKWLKELEISDGNTIDIQKQAENKANSVLTCKNISYGYGSENILRAFSIDVPINSIYAILGGNGSGKTTALKLMSGIYKAKKGKLKSIGRVIYLPQNPQTVFTEITVWDELIEAYLSHKVWFKNMTEKDKHANCEQMLDFMELIEHKNKNPFDLSGGQQQRLALAKVLLLKPDILLMDEPAKGLDCAFKNKLSDMLKKLAKDSLTIVMVSHDINFCAETADYCSLLFNGELTRRETTNKFFSNNYFYTTSVNRMFKLAGLGENIVTYEQAVNQMTGLGFIYEKL